MNSRSSSGFHFDDIAADSTVASSLRNMMCQAMEARAELSNHPATAIERYIETMMKSRGLSREAATAGAADTFASVVTSTELGKAGAEN